MTMIESLKSLCSGRLVFHETNTPETKCDYLLLDNCDKILAFGWQLKNNIADGQYNFFDKMKMDRNGQLKSDVEVAPDSTFYFVANDNFLWFLDSNSTLPIGNRQDSPELFIRRLKVNFPHLKSDIELKNPFLWLPNVGAIIFIRWFTSALC